MSIKVVEYISLTFFMISFPLYIVFTIILFRGRNSEFSDPFYSFVRSLAVADLLILVWNQITWKFPLLGICSEFYMSGGRSLAVVLFAVDVFFRKAGDFILVDLIINRVTATVFHKRHQKFWNKRRTRVAVFVQWGLALALSLPSLFFEYEWIAIDYGYGLTNNTIYAGLTDATNYRKYMFILVLTNFGRVAMSAVCYLLILWKWAARRWVRRRTTIERRWSLNHTEMSQNMKKDLEMTWAFLAISFIDLMRFVWFLIVYNMKDQTYQTVALITLFYVSTLHEFYSWSKPYIFIICCPKVRQKFLHFVRKRKPTPPDSPQASLDPMTVSRHTIMPAISTITTAAPATLPHHNSW